MNHETLNTLVEHGSTGMLHVLCFMLNKMRYKKGHVECQHVQYNTVAEADNPVKPKNCPIQDEPQMGF